MMTQGYDVAIQGLIRKRAEIACAIGVLNDQLTDAMCQLEHVDATLRILDPDFQPEGIPARAPAAPHQAAKGQGRRVMLSLLRENGPMTTQELAKAMIEQRGLNAADKTLLRTIHARASSALRSMRQAGKVVSEHTGENGLLRWTLAK